MKSIGFVVALAFVASLAYAKQYAIDPQTGQAYPVVQTRRGAMAQNPETGQTYQIVQPSQTCDDAKWRLQENMRMAAAQGRPLPAIFIAASRRRIAHLCEQ
ncbi:hypothetical protein CUJ89_28520 [Burkholderia pyrrocinia]|uniref:Uncharacterized protein n=1 Tax=Burkholderia pyrrocinia TaxID=60550 RepID=A0A2Z5N4U6_BURPY|nr:hypothetical protein CUJ89_28520 [Burkholderia pyrrocinia]